MNKRRKVRAQRAHDEGRELGYLQGRHEVLTQVVDGGLRLLTALLQIGLAVETAKATPLKTPPWSDLFTGTSPLCDQRPQGLACGCVRAKGHDGNHHNGTDAWIDCGAKNPAYVMECNDTRNCTHAKGHFGSHSNGVAQWPA